MKKSPRKKTPQQSADDLDHVKTAIDDHFYRLDARKPVRCTLAEYALAMLDETQRVLAQTQVGDLHVSSIFIGIDQNFGTGPVLLFETLVFGLPDDLRPRWLHATWADSMAWHRQLVQSLNESGQQALLDEVRFAKSKDG
jgi:hypothetical protein